MKQRTKLVIIGSGPAALTAAIYAARANLEPIVFEGFSSGPAGGQLMTTTEVENFPGFPEGVTGPELMERMRKQAIRFGTEILTEDVVTVELEKRPFVVKGRRTSIQADALVIATGATARRLNVPGSKEFWQKGVTACAVCDGAAPIFHNQDLYVIGGGDTAVEEAIFLTKYGKKVFLVHRREELRASEIMADRVKKHPKIEILWNHELVRIEGDTVVRRVVLKNVKTHQESTFSAGGVFFAIGHDPNTKFLGGQLKLKENNYIHVDQGTPKTNIEGVFASGDVHDHVYRQAITAAGYGCMAAMDAEKWLSEKGHF
ncbi:MAG TPA: thioredoxin-disulfide reductase [Candidatus Rhabdochlamydia sp.]|jgi:thioredoxin reductase (NADPH)|nr:thioredoxin-disulfide reductase [Candidatus Rhabdochlamydia sp.]